MNDHGRPEIPRRFQVFDRMRVPTELRPFALRVHAVQAVRCNQEIKGESCFRAALADLDRGQNFQIFDEVATLMKQIVAKELEGKELAAATGLLAKLGTLDDGDEAYPHIEAFNRAFLNDNGLDALLWMLVVQATDLDLVAIDEYRGGKDLQAAYGSRRTRALRRRGKELQARLKTFASFDETAITNAADQWVVYRHLDHGRFPDYTRRAELNGLPSSERNLRRWFNDFDRALGLFPSSARTTPQEGPHEPVDRPKTLPDFGGYGV